ncbi:acyl-CoA synthetase FdrA [Bailinhaonella thermotolerans]|uniref:Acyl-CoA synthetase FdrA n=1 Tax=Bailinhaonella thermotolerans TaxID=1070861 RepID=A0A3A4BXA1_9ACTN|nr:acyl-CoA synthetase FdrA [Bailinhaonella thermotolerans]
MREHRIYPNRYQDSVALMALSAALAELPGVETASVVMGTGANLDNLREAGLGEVDAGPGDLVVAVLGEEEAVARALELADERLAEQPSGDAGDGAVARRTLRTLRQAVEENPAHNLALISVPGPYAAAEALKALRLGLNVMVFSDNVPLDQEIEIKRFAEERDLLVMGPDCGTAIVNGLPLGFANVVRRGRIGVVGASGTGTQEITTRVHQLGEGISQALGTGGHDLSAEVGAISMLRGLRALAADEETDVIVLVSKPPAETVAKTVVEEARTLDVPVVICFLGADPAAFGGDGQGVHFARTLAGSADAAVALARGETPPAESAAPPYDQVRFAPGQRYLRGVFTGGTFCYEAQLLAQDAGIQAASNTPVAGNLALADVRASTGHTILDLGDDAFTQGRPHPMIDPLPRDERLLAEAADPATAVVLFDVVLGYGSADDPISGLLKAIGEANARAGREGRALAFVAHVCGTDDDPQDRSAVVARLREAGVLVAENNAQAAAIAAGMTP